MAGNEAGLEVAIPAALKDHSSLTVRIGAAAFVPTKLYSRSFSFMVGDAIVGSVTFSQTEKVSKRFDLEVPMPGSDSFQLRIIAHEQASPAEEGSDDRRFLGLALIDIALY